MSDVRDDLATMLLEENRRLRSAGDALAARAIYSATEYDGLHRLMAAAAGWYATRASEHGRPGGPDRSSYTADLDPADELGRRGD